MGGQNRETLNYSILAGYYDRLVKDDEASAHWCAYTKKRIQGDKILELACGSGEITLRLAELGFRMTALDLSEEMIRKAQEKDVDDRIAYHVGDMRDLSGYEMYDGILCFCDSINYLSSMSELKKMFHEVHGHLTTGATFLFDMHTEARLTEFEDPFIEEGWIDDTGYQWAIESDNPRVIHHFRFYQNDGSVLSETHVQTVFPLDEVVEALTDIGFKVEVTSDFEEEKDAGAEKYFIHAIKE